jgi:hypothetical protein
MKRLIERFSFMKIMLIVGLVTGLVLASCGKDDDDTVPPANKTALQDSVDVAQALYDASVEVQNRANMRKVRERFSKQCWMLRRPCLQIRMLRKVLLPMLPRR